MRSYSLRHLDDATLAREFPVVMIQDRAMTARTLVYIAEFDHRRLNVPAGYESMFAYCVQGFGLSEDEAYKRIRSARTALRFPAIFGLVTEGRLHLTAVRCLSAHLTPENADELLASAQGLSTSELEQLLAVRFGPREPGRSEPRSVVKPIMSAQPKATQ